MTCSQPRADRRDDHGGESTRLITLARGSAPGVACDTSGVNFARVSLTLLAMLAAVAVASPASASDAACPMPNGAGAEPAPDLPITIGWHGGGGFVDRCTTTTGTGVAEPAVQDPMAAPSPAAQHPTAVPASPAAKPTAKATAKALKAKKAKKAKAKRKSAKARRHAKCLVRR
jgi:hypothetical protein